MSQRTAVRWAMAVGSGDLMEVVPGFRFVRRNMFERSSRRAETNSPMGFREMRLVNASGSGSVFNGGSAFDATRNSTALNNEHSARLLSAAVARCVLPPVNNFAYLPFSRIRLEPA